MNHSGTLQLSLAGFDGSTRAGPPAALAIVIEPNPIAQTAIAWAPDGKTLATGGRGILSFWPAIVAAPRTVALAGDVAALAYDPAGNLAVAGSAGVTWLSARTPTAPRTLAPRLPGCRALALAAKPFDASGARLAAGCDDRDIHLIDPDRGGNARILRGHTGWVTALALDADATRLASGSDDRTIRIWELRTGKLITTLTGHSDSIRALAFDGPLLLSASADGTVQTWINASEAGASYRPGADVLALAAGPHHLYASADRTGALRIWPPGVTMPPLGTIRALAWSPSGVLAAVGDRGVLTTISYPGMPQSVKMPAGAPR